MAHGDTLVGNWSGKLANAVGSQYPSHYLGTRCIQHYYRWWRTPRLSSSRLHWRPAHRADLNGLVRFAPKDEIWVSARVPSHFNWPVLRNVSIGVVRTQHGELWVCGVLTANRYVWVLINCRSGRSFWFERYPFFSPHLIEFVSGSREGCLHYSGGPSALFV